MRIETEKKQIASINILRFMAALFVMMYHYTFMFFHRGNTYLDFSFLRSIFHYGYLGVDLFFIISGFVVALSAEGRTCKDFVVSRMTRLYPMLWVSVSLTSLTFIVASFFVKDVHITLAQYVANMTLVPSLFHLPLVDDSYWSLAVELKFYAFIGLLVLFGLFRYIKEIALALSFVLFTLAFFYNLAPNYISYFLAGILFYSVYRKGFSWISSVALFLLMSVSVKYATSFAPDLALSYHFPFSSTVIGVYIIIFYGMFFAISTNVLSLQTRKLYTILGAITYPVYLLHQEIGRVLFKVLEMKALPSWLAFTVISILIGVLAYSLHIFYEKKAQQALKSALLFVANPIENMIRWCVTLYGKNK